MRRQAPGCQRRGGILTCVGRPVDTFMQWLMRPWVRRVRRWLFVATAPAGLLVAHVYRVHEGVAVVAGGSRCGGWWRSRRGHGWGPRRRAARSVMHPRLRAFGRAQLDILTAVPRLVLVRVMRAGRDGVSYMRGTFGLVLALAFTPVM